MASIYDLKKPLRLIFVVVAILLAVTSAYVTYSLVERLKQEEQGRMQIWADATRELVNLDILCDLTFAQEVIEQNTTIPVILVDSSFQILSYRNIDYDGLTDQKLQTLAKSFAQINAPIVIDMGEGEEQYICYGDSTLLKQLAYFPLLQMFIFSAFTIMVIFFLVYTKRSEQDRVWIGLSRETAHQLGTPISSLMAWLEIIKTTYPEAVMLAEMEHDINRLRTISERFSQIGSKTDLEMVSVNEILERSIYYMQARISKRIKIEYTTKSDACTLMNIPLFEWVIENLCKNAVDAMGGDGSININFFDKDDKILIIEVSDSGQGIPRSKMNVVFSPGYTTKQRGWGLGLSLVKRIVEEFHKGKIYVKKTSANTGATFRIELKKV